MSSKYKKFYGRAGLALFILGIVWCVTLLDVTIRFQTDQADVLPSSSSHVSSNLAVTDLEQLKVNILVLKSLALLAAVRLVFALKIHCVSKKPDT